MGETLSSPKKPGFFTRGPTVAQATRATARGRWAQILRLGLTVIPLILLVIPALAVVKDFPWGNQTGFAPDNEVPGCYFNLAIMAVGPPISPSTGQPSPAAPIAAAPSSAAAD